MPPSTIPLVLTAGYVLTHGPKPVVPTIRPRAVYPLHIQTSLDGGCALTDVPVAVVPTIRPHAVYPLHIHISLDVRFCTHSQDRPHSVSNSATYRVEHFTSLDGRFCTHYGPVPIVPTKRPNAGYPLHIHTCLNGRCERTHGRVSTRIASKTATCHISIAHSL